MNRQEKIRLLKAVKAGILKPEDLIFEPCYIFFEENEDCYRMNDLKYTKLEFEAYLEDLRMKDERRRAAGLPGRKVITVVYREQGLNAPILD